MLQDFLQTLKDPAARHAMLVHLPIIVGVMGLLPLIALAFTRFRSPALKAVIILTYLIGAAGAFLAADAGADSKGILSAVSPPLTPAEQADLHDHEELGENGWIWMLIPAALTGASFLKKNPLRIAAGSLAIAGACGILIWAAKTGQAGGRLVYTDGLGVPHRSALPRTGP